MVDKVNRAARVRFDKVLSLAEQAHEASGKLASGEVSLDEYLAILDELVSVKPENVVK